MRSYNWIYSLVIIGTIILISTSCEKDNKDDVKIKKEQVTGLVQKGPYINSTQILMAELNSSMDQIGNIFSTQITNDKGSFEINNIELSSSFVEFSASGYYFNEVGGIISTGTLALYALSDITDISTVNVNILIHLERQRVEYLIKIRDYSFESAKDSAQKEILIMFGFHNDEMMISEALDITSNEEVNAILLAISVILQGDRGIGTLTELLANISNDLKEDGVLSDENILNGNAPINRTES